MGIGRRALARMPSRRASWVGLLARQQYRESTEGLIVMAAEFRAGRAIGLQVDMRKHPALAVLGDLERSQCHQTAAYSSL